VLAALHAIRHRGPDANGFFVDPTRTLAMGHARLAVIDVRPESNQPFWSECGRYCVVFNGEIYNYVELRQELERLGVSFRTASDTEVLLKALMHWGEQAHRRFNGMWAFVFADLRERRALLGRDRWGVKPMFMAHSDGQTVICSEAKGIHAYRGYVPEPNRVAIGVNLKYSVGGEFPSSWFAGIDRFPQGCWQSCPLGSRSPSEPPTAFWTYPEPMDAIGEGEADRRFAELLDDAIRIRLRSDVPLGISLSGGLDSSTIAWLVGQRFHQRLDAFTAWFKPREKSELPMAQSIAERFGHRSFSVAEADVDGIEEDLRSCVFHLDAGHHSHAIVPYLNLCRAARKRLTVMLEGQGADELLAGYSYMYPFGAVDSMLSGDMRGALRTIRAQIASDGWLRSVQEWIRYSSRTIYLHQDKRWGSNNLLGDGVLDAPHGALMHFAANRRNLYDQSVQHHRTGLTSLLQYGDAISMSVNLETRCPFLDFRLVEFSMALPNRLRLRDGFGKHILRRMAAEHLPSEITWQRRKLGFVNSTIRTLRERHRVHGLPDKTVECAVDLGLLQARIRDPEVVERLPDSVFFRLSTLLAWLDVFYLRTPVRPAQLG
jgi:asparagine synthase (glutamine-hydrolysing)